jgi:FkbM family methyltransferase
MRQQTLDDMEEMVRRARLQERDLEFLGEMPPVYLLRLFELFSESHAQFHQDLFALVVSGFKSGGYFVEFGATDGRGLSNTNLLETKFQWTGVLAEPAIKWHGALRANRLASIDPRCVWRTSGERLTFNETEIGEYSTIHAYSDRDFHAGTRTKGRHYDVETVSLLDLLETHNAPSYVDYLSIDTEGSEYEILNSFDFDRFRFGFISCEHNFTGTREKIHALLTAHGYRRVLEKVSAVDDWYLDNKLASTLPWS